jgi:PKD repeat protein
MKFHPTNSQKLYAVSARGGLFISSNGGSNWAVAPGCDKLVSGVRFASVCIDHVNDQVIYLGGGDHNYYSSGSGVWKTTDGGNTFTQTSLTGKIVVDMIMDPTNNNVIVAATNTGVYKTADAGATWTLKSASLALDDLKQLQSNNSRVLFISTRNAELYRSTDFGDTWTQITSGIFIPTGYTSGGGTRVAVTPADSNVVYFYMNAQGGTLFKSTDGGLNFSAVKNSLSPFLTGYSNNSADPGQGDYNTGIGVDRLNANIVYFVAHNVWKSTDGGATWTQLTVWYQKVHTDMHQIVTSPYNNNQLWNMNDGGVWLSTDGGNNWTPKSDGIYGIEIYHGGCSPTRRYMMSIGTQDNGELYADSTKWYCNRGGDWQSHCVFDYRANSSMVYYFLPDWGTIWAPKRRLVTGSTQSYNLPASVTDFSDIAFYRGNADLAFIGDTQVWRTTNLTVTSPTWTQIANTGVKVMALHVNFSDPNNVYVVTSDQKIGVSRDALSAVPTWTWVTLPSATGSRASITTIKSSPNVVYISCNNKVYRSADHGATWTNVTYNLPTTNHIAIIADEYFSSNELVFLATGSVVYYKTATATSWTIYNTGLPTRTSIVDMSIYNDGTSNTVLRTFTYGRGVWETPINNLRSTTANFTVDNQTPCPGQTVNFSDVSTGTVVSRTWSFPGGTPATSTAANPSVTYASSGAYNVTLTVSNGTTNSTLTETNYINTMGAQLPVSQGFESGVFPPANWTNVDALNNAIAWQLKNGVGGFGLSSNCMFFDNYSVDAGGARDEFRSVNIDLASYASATLTFDVAYQPYSTTSYIDSFQVLVSGDCGTTFNSVYLKYGTALSTATGTNTAAFVPTATQWRTETVNLNAYAGQKIVLSFRNIGRYGNNLYLDNILLNGTLASLAGPDKSICDGGSTTIGVAPISGNTYSWSPSTGLSSATVANPVASPATTTTYTVTVTQSGGATATDMVMVTVNPLPSVSVSTTPATKVGVSDGTATASVTGGTPSYSYVWNSTPVQTTATATNLASGTYAVTVTDANGCSATGSGTVGAPICALSLSETHVDPVCYGASTGSIAVTSTGANGAVNYKLQPGNVTNSTGSFSGLSAGNYTVTVTDAALCTAVIPVTLTQPAQMTVAVTASGPTTFCSGNSIELTATGAVSYLWNTGSTTSSITVGVSGTYTVTGTDANGCTAQSAGTVITVQPLVTPTISISASPSGTIIPSATVTFTAGITNGGASPVYRWMKNGTTVGTNSATYSAASWVNGDMVNCELTSNVNCATVGVVTSNSIILSVNAATPKYLVSDIVSNKVFYYDASFGFIASSTMSTTVLNGVTNAADIAAVTGSVYVLDGTNKRVYRSTSAGTASTASRTLVSNTGTVLGTPTGLAVSNDTLWILDKKGKAIYRYSLSAAFTGTGNLNALQKISLATANKTAESLVAYLGYFYVLENGTTKTFYRYPKAGGTGVVSRAMVSTTGTALGTVTGAVFDNGELRIVDSGQDRSLSYSLSALYTGSGSLNAATTNSLNAANLNSTGITLVNTTTLIRNQDNIGVTSSDNGLKASAYPNPATGLFKVRIEGAVTEKTAIQLFDLNGRLIGEQYLEVSSETFHEVEFDLSRHPSGNYLVSVNNGTIRKSFIVTH